VVGRKYDVRVTKGAIKLGAHRDDLVVQSQSRKHAGRFVVRTPEDVGVEEDDGEFTARKQTTMSTKSRMGMRYMYSSLPWDMLGARPVMITLTYPADWRACVSDAKELARHRNAFKRRWRRAYGTLIGVWVVEFQPRLRRPVNQRDAPHIHMYLRLPDEVGQGEYEALIARTLGRKRLEMMHGKYKGRARVKPPEGPFAEWVLQNWHEIAGTTDRFHKTRGADITAVFWSDDAEKAATRERIADYFWRESGKAGQKVPPGRFGRVAFYGRWGQEQGFSPVEGGTELERVEWVLMRRAVRRLVEQQRRNEAKRRGFPYRPARRTGRASMNGVTAFLVGAPGVARRLVDWAADEAAARVSEPTASVSEIF
jgi:hypothetical protein